MSSKTDRQQLLGDGEHGGRLTTVEDDAGKAGTSYGPVYSSSSIFRAWVPFSLNQLKSTRTSIPMEKSRTPRLA